MLKARQHEKQPDQTAGNDREEEEKAERPQRAIAASLLCPLRTILFQLNLEQLICLVRFVAS